MNDKNQALEPTIQVPEYDQPEYYQCAMEAHEGGMGGAEVQRYCRQVMRAKRLR